jgi:hypothetical protein
MICATQCLSKSYQASGSDAIAWYSWAIDIHVDLDEGRLMRGWTIKSNR